MTSEFAEATSYKGAADPEDQLHLLEKYLHCLTKTTDSNLGNKCKNTTFDAILSTINYFNTSQTSRVCILKEAVNIPSCGILYFIKCWDVLQLCLSLFPLCFLRQCGSNRGHCTESRKVPIILLLIKYIINCNSHHFIPLSHLLS